MRELRTCDFCDGSAAGTFEPVPEWLSPDGEGAIRVTLCESCRSTLETIVEPLLSAADAPADRDDKSPSTRSTGPSTGESSAGPATQESTAESRDDQSTEPVAEPSGPVGQTTSTDESSVSRRSGRADDGTESRRAESADKSAPSGGSNDRGEGTSSATSVPSTYPKVMRLLRNRTLPIERETATQLASSAYELEGTDVDEMIDLAVELGDLVEDGGRIDVP